MDFAFWFAPAAAFAFCIARSNLGRALAAQACSAMPAAFRSVFRRRPAGYPALQGG
jgi:hypothetical protein